ncbi:MAG: methionine adenosyltransferase [Gemmatimonadota bacterium]
MTSQYILTSESVSEGHPDKVADRISDAVVDAYLARDPEARVACETLVTQNFVCIAGEVRSRASISGEEIEALARDAIRAIGYVDDDGRFSADGVEVEVRLHEQAREIAKAVDKEDRTEQGAGDQGMMFGYATDETPALMPTPITWAHALTRRLAELRRGGGTAWLRPDAKSQVSVRYRDGRPVAVTQIVVSTQHAPDVDRATIRELVVETLVPAALPTDALPDDWRDRVLVNPSGSFTLGGPATDTGLTGRKIIVDTYGGAARHGGGAFSGKDPSKVDRSGAYAARWAAKNVVAAGLARRCEVCLAYAIGVAEPVAVAVETFGTAEIDERAIGEWLHERFDLTPRGIIDGLDLLRPIYGATAAYGHFGREPVAGTFPWERVAAADAGAKRLADAERAPA